MIAGQMLFQPLARGGLTNTAGLFHPQQILPLVTALVAWEVRSGREWPLLGLAVSAATWLTFVTNHGRATDRPFFLYLAWALPLLVLPARHLYGLRAPLLSRRPWPVDPSSGAPLSSPSTSTT